MALTGTRIGEVRYDLLTLSEIKYDELPSATTGGSLSFSAARTVNGIGELVCVNPGVDWLTTKIRPYFILNGVEYPLGIYIPSVPGGAYGPRGSRFAVKLMDKLTVLDEDQIEDWLTIPADKNGVDAIRENIESTGEPAGALTPSPDVLRNDMVFEPGTTKLQVVNKISEAIGYFSLAVDWRGQYRAEPYVRPLDRPLVHVFDESRRSQRTPEFEREQDLYRVPNAVTVVSNGTGDEPGLVGYAENNNPDSPFSIMNRGRRIFPDGGIETIEAATQEIIDAHAQRRLIEQSSPTAKLTVTHAYRPMALNDAVGFGSSLVDTSSRTTITNMDIVLDTKALMVTQLREVVDV